MKVQLSEKKKQFLTVILKKGIFTISIGCVGVYMAFLWLIRPMPDPYGDVLSDSKYYIAHAAGALDGYRYMNCREALICTIDNG